MYLISMQCMVLTPQCLTIPSELGWFWYGCMEETEPEASGITDKPVLLWKPLKVLLLSKSNHDKKAR